MKREELKAYLPHRNSMLLLDEAMEKDGIAEGIYHVRGDEFFLDGHFPGNPIVPGVILCEILAQTACVLLRDAGEDDRNSAGAAETSAANGAQKNVYQKLPVYTGLNNVKFRSPVNPGDTVRARCEITRVKRPFYFAKGNICVGERLCMSAEFSFAVTGSK